MRYLIPVALVAVMLAWTFLPDDPHLPPAPQDLATPTPTPTPTPTQTKASAHARRTLDTDLVPARVPEGSERTAAVAEAVLPEVDPCAELAEALTASDAARVAAEQEAQELRDQVAQLQHPEDTPYGAFLRSYEASEITDPDLRRDIEAWLQVFPIILRPGEATWIVERETANDWRSYSLTAKAAIIKFLGPQRLLAELPPERAAELRDDYADDDEVDFDD